MTDVAVNVSLLAEKPTVDVIPPDVKTDAIVCAGRAEPAVSNTVTVIFAFSNGAYVALSKAIFTDPGEPAETVSVISSDVAVAAATVEASMILNLAVQTSLPVTLQRIPLVDVHAEQATGVSEPAISALAAEVA